VYAKTLSIYDFKCFGKAVMELQYPGRTAQPLSELDNVNLVLGDNGGGKSSVLRALAIAMLAPALTESGFVPYRLVRRGGKEKMPVVSSLLRVDAMRSPGEDIPELGRLRKFELLARIDQRGQGNQDRLHLEHTPASPVIDALGDDYSQAFFVVGYGATRRVETGDYSESSARRSRGLRYQRIAGLFEDHLALRPLQSWLVRLKNGGSQKYEDVIRQLNRVLPDAVRFTGEFDEVEGQFLFDFEGTRTPFSALSDGYKAFIGWVGDLLGHLSDVATTRRGIGQVSGIVLVDEIDLHLHPAWQRTVVPALAMAFPNLQFVFTSHSPLIASTVKKENVFVTDVAPTGTATIKQLKENVYGRSAEQLLLSSYFGLTSTRAESFQQESEQLFSKAAEGDSSAALDYLAKLTSSGS
jgi:predicted ATPase